MGVFAYSSEDDTYAFKMYDDNIPQEVKEERAAELMEMQQDISAVINQRLIGKTLKVLVDREETEFFVGRTEYDSPEVDGEVLIEKAENIKIGNFYRVKINDATEFDLFGNVE